jgi:hypothetical protein
MAAHLTLEQHLQSAPETARVLAHAKLLVRVGHLYESLAPGMLAGASRVANIKSGIVVIHADNGAVAAKLRQIAGRLTDEFSKRGVECSGIEVRVQPSTVPAETHTVSQHPLSDNARQDITVAMNSMRDDEPLKAALATLLRRAGGKNG